MSNKLCECPLAGFCQRHQREKNIRHHQLCSGVNCKPSQTAKYWDDWERQRAATDPEFVPKLFQEGIPLPTVVRSAGPSLVTGPSRAGGVGTELKTLLAWFGQYASAGCSCQKYSAMMDQNGVEWCEQNTDTVIGWLSEEASKRKVLGWSLDKVPGFEWTARQLVERAIANAKKKRQVITIDMIRDTRKLTPLTGQPIDREKLQSHILYHVMPLAGDTEWVWRRHIDWLRQERWQFNGRMIVGIVTPSHGDGFHYCSPDAVKEACSGLDAEFFEAPNDLKPGHRRGLGEGVLFPRMLGALETSDPNQVAFYGHCKGVTRPGSPDAVPHLWAEAMFDLLFRNHDEAVASLDCHGITGSFMVHGGVGVGRPGVGRYFYSGTFFAMRLADVFRRNWRNLPAHYGCVEQWPRLMFRAETEADCLFGNYSGNLYDEGTWRNKIIPELEQRTALSLPGDGRSSVPNVAVM